MALRAFSCNPSLGGFGSENVAASAGRRRHRQEGQPPPRQDPTAGGDVRRTPRSIGSDGKGDGASQGRRRECTEANQGRAPDRNGGGGDAMAQILKELVDNAVDACCAAAATKPNRPEHDDGIGGAGKDEPITLKRVRVIIEPVVGDRTEDEADDASASAPLRVSVNDNGIGMGSIEDCVEAFRTSKRSDGNGNGNAIGDSSQSSIDPGSMGGSIDADGSAPQDGTCVQSQLHPRPSGESQTAGRYGIGLTLCLLHSQRLCPDSVASITSATADATQWIRASYVVDTEGDRVRCVKKELLDKKRPGESGTMVSLLVPGGLDAAAVWPRLAEYFARFQLSDMSCSLEVKAPTLSTVPLYIRPTFELERRQQRFEERKVRQRSDERQTQKLDKEDADGDDGNDESENNNVITAGSQNSTATGNNYGDADSNRIDAMESDGEEWDDGLTVDDDANERRFASLSRLATPAGEKNDNSKEQIDHTTDQSQTSLDSSKKDSDKGDGEDVGRGEDGAANEESSEDKRRKFIQRATSTYLNRNIELRNVAHSVNCIRREESSGAESSKLQGTATRSGTDRPMLEVDMVVYGRAPPNDHDHSDGEESGSSNAGDEFDAILDGNNHSNEESGEAAKLILIRMVNRIPLLDGAEASSCGLVRGISKKKSTWNSYGLEISHLAEDRVPCALGENAAPHNEVEAYIPTYHLKDSAQVAPFFRSNSTHALYESDSDDNDESDTDEEEESDCSYDSSEEGEKRNARKKRKRKRRTKLLPSGIRLGNVLVIAQIHANPSALPLPTLSKGRLPMNDPDIDDALEVGLSSCLRSLQRSNPELLLTANQLKRTERDVRYLPAIAASLASIVKNSSDAEFRSDVYGKVMSWQRDKADEESEEKSNDFSFELDALDISPKASPDTEQRNNGDDNSSSSSKSSSLDSEQEMNESMDRLSAMRLSSLIEHRLRYCISDENKQRKKEEERERKLEARRKEKARKEKAKQKQKQKQNKKRRPAGKSKKPMFRSGDISDGDNSNIDLDDLLLDGESEEMGYSQDSDDSSVIERRKRASRIRDLAFIDSDDESSTGSTSTKSSKSSGHCQSKRNGTSSDGRGMEEEIDGDQLGEGSDFSEDESILRPSEDVVPQKVEAHRSRLRNEEEEEKKDDGFGDGFENDDDDDDWL